MYFKEEVINLDGKKALNKRSFLKISLIIFSIISIFLISSFIYDATTIEYKPEKQITKQDEHTYLIFFKSGTNPDLNDFITKSKNYEILDELNAIVIDILPEKYDILKTHKDIESSTNECPGYRWEFNYNLEERKKLLKAMSKYNEPTRYNVWFDDKYTKDIKKYLESKNVDIILLDVIPYSGDIFVIVSEGGQEENIEKSNEVSELWKINAPPVMVMTNQWVARIICHRPMTQMPTVN